MKSLSMNIDHEARQAAALANQKIDAHEDRCAERWREARDQMRETRDEIRGLRQTSRGTLLVLIGWGLMALFFLWERLA
jgi:Flp pilus assembly protein TadB